MKVVTVEDMVYPANGDIGFLVPDDLVGLPCERLRFVNGEIVDASDLTEFFVEPVSGMKHAVNAQGRQAVACAWDQDIVKIDGIWIALTEEVRFSQAKAKRISALSADCETAIFSGFRSDALGADHSYPAKERDQINLMGSVTASLLPGIDPNWSTPFWCADENGEWAFRPHTAEQIRQAGSDGKAHVVTCQSTLEALSIEVMGAEPGDDLDAITWPSPSA